MQMGYVDGRAVLSASCQGCGCGYEYLHGAGPERMREAGEERSEECRDADCGCHTDARRDW